MPNMMSASEGGGSRKSDKCRQGGGGGQKTRKFCRHHLSMAPNPEPCQNGLSSCMPCSGPRAASSSVSCFDLEVCISPFFCSTTTFLLARLVRFGPQPILWSYLAVSLLSSPPKKADSQSCAHRCLLRENPLTHRKSRRGRRLTCGAALFIGERE